MAKRFRSCFLSDDGIHMVCEHWNGKYIKFLKGGRGKMKTDLVKESVSK